ncbi:NAD(P)-binding protein [Panus rudis PR-1116 ss-1]|nr:NAD(P)-binding protein [Panus rudis PR-1116 ss-1]
MSDLADLISSTDPRILPINFFTPTIHNKPNAIIDPANNRLSTPFHVCIIGASRGIGAGVATSYAKAGASVLVLAARNVDKLNSVAATVRSISPSTTVHVHPCDIASATSVKELAEFSKSVLPSSRLDVVVVNSGVTGIVESKITDGDAENGDWDEVFKINTLGTYYAAHYFVPILLASPEGSAKAFIGVGSFAAAIRRGMGANSKYCISKLAQARVIEHLAEQFGDQGLLSVTIHPGGVNTDMAKAAAPPEVLAYLLDDPTLCGAYCVWVTKDTKESKWLNGRLISACWDPKELLAKKEEVIRGDLLKFELATSVKK